MSFKTFVSSFIEKSQGPGPSGPGAFNAGMFKSSGKKSRSLENLPLGRKPSIFAIAKDDKFRNKFLEKTVSLFTFYSLKDE